MRKDLVLVGLITCILGLMVLPLSPVLIDVLLAVNITLSIILLLVGVYLKNPSDFSTFPSVILIGTAFRLALSIATTRLILTEAEGGEIITTFGEFVVGGSVAVGLVIFLVITVVQFLVVTKGAERVAEVAARFALDALPGKQMAIDADIRAGTLDAVSGERMRQRLSKESQFFGSMDGAMKFVKGDAIAGLIIVAINLIGGMVVGVALHGMSFAESAALFSLLTVGDGLVAQIPALLMALCAGIIVTRSTGPENSDLGSDIGKELTADARVPGIAAILALGMGLIPGFPTLIFCLGALGLGVLAFLIAKRQRDAVQAEADKAIADLPAVVVAVEDHRVPPVNDRFCLSLGPELAGQLDPDALWLQLDHQFARLRLRTGVEFATPAVVVRSQLGPWSFKVELDEVPLLSETLPEAPAIFPRTDAGALRADGGRILHWPSQETIVVPRSAARALGLTGHAELSLSDLLLEQVFRLFESNIGPMFSRREFDLLLEQLTADDPESMAQIRQATKPATLFQVFQALVEDGVPLRPGQLVLEALQFWTQMPEVTTPALLAECLRGSLKRQMCHMLVGPEGMLGLVLIDPEFENAMRKTVSEARKTPGIFGFEGLPLPSDLIEPTLSAFRQVAQSQREPGHQVAVVIGADLRRRLRNFLAQNDIQLPVFSPHEIPREIRTFPLEVLRLPVLTNGPRMPKAA